ncbi:aminodeoxychorismate/anthranilate synthase component II [Gordonibacter sp. 28C]|uniref:anthranilate synthase component II n=1 Tax=Gordonibacter sp. 28C TaxID=2078569 RepID=UPI000DF81785|nr:aminodeoxychorismate/anthranilate synthase component II [Gordonibacter sp. 28C]RDB63821.1 aminodeoxychorismate/anthranilate synthase component II [Gordonibacter sp. 28C]
MILLVDNYDSFAYNLYQMAGAVRPDIQVVRNDAVSLDDVAALAPDALILSPGPGRPEDAGVCMEAVERFAGAVPILGVCLGHQAICAAFGATVGYAKELMHGKVSPVETTGESALFAGLPRTFPVARYHSLAVDERTLPPGLRVSARTADGEVMAVEHRELPVFGVQFHPESVMTPDGAAIVGNFLALAGRA